MAYCGPRGIPLSVFLGWAESDQEAALAWSGYEARRCSSCGTHPDEGPRHAHVDVCPGCVDRARITSEELPRGSHVRLIAGSPATCKRCSDELAANRSR